MNAIKGTFFIAIVWVAFPFFMLGVLITDPGFRRLTRELGEDGFHSLVTTLIDDVRDLFRRVHLLLEMGAKYPEA